MASVRAMRLLNAIGAAAVNAAADNAQTTTLCTPLNGPITFTTSDTTAFNWYFGLLRCDV